ncbi:MAG TPA: beta-N-acetylhexosaminidase [Terriglobia bacterium]|nr:beta-N-acetylhexosaminidase [Terriglobia bacterium]
MELLIRRFAVLGTLVIAYGCLAGTLRAATASPLFSRGYTVIPEPQKVTLSGRDFQVAAPWRLELAPGVQADDVAVVSLREGLSERFHFALSEAKGNGGAALKLAIDAHAVEVGAATDREKSALAEQAYRMQLAPEQVTITGNSSTGLFYGVQTLVQLLKPQDGKLWLPEGEIIDWPDLELRVIYWDDAHHLEYLKVLKAAVRQAAFYKINGFSIKLEGHFQYHHAPAMVEPYAMTPAELQELTEYALKYHVELIPYLDGPAHDAFILKHPEYARLREYPDSNYEFCVTNPDTYKLLYRMFDDLLGATKGSRYFVLSTDEPYYVGLAKNAQCNEVDRAKELGSVGKLLGEFVTKTAGYLHDRGRQVIFWGEYPMVPADIASVPGYLINGEVYGPEFDPVFRAHGLRQLIFTSTVGWKEFLFPNYYLLPQDEHIPGPPGGAYESVSQGPGVVEELFDAISHNAARQNADLMGALVAGWGDVGLHPETMWLGYATGSASGWHPGSPEPQESMSSFYKLFYGPGATGMGRLYQLMSEQGQFWKESWETKPSAARTPLWGDWNIIYPAPRPAEDQTLPLLPVPSPPLLTLGYDWAPLNTRRLQMAGKFLADNDELLDLIHANMDRAEFQHYNLEIFLAIAQLFRQNLHMLRDLNDVNDELKSAERLAGQAEAASAVASLDHALDLAESVERERNDTFQEAVATWYKSWYPRVPEANGRVFLNKVDDAKDHLPLRTVDMTYLIYRQLLYPLGDWAEKTVAVRNQYAGANHLPLREFKLDWKNTMEPAAQPNGE